jgi:hypothetical protein
MLPVRFDDLEIDEGAARVAMDVFKSGGITESVFK